MIACRFVNIAPDRYECDDAGVDFEGLDRTSDGRPVVLLMDELNPLSSPLEYTASRFPKEQFLDRKGRSYLVFTTHV